MLRLERLALALASAAGRSPDPAAPRPPARTAPSPASAAEVGLHLLPGFAGLRLLAAASLLISHAYLISLDTLAADPITALPAARHATAAFYGMALFFIASGYWLAGFLRRERSINRLLIRLGVCILPGFVVCVLVTALVIGPLASGLGPAAYLARGQWLSYILHSLTSLADAPLLGVFDHPGSLATVVNGSLWPLQDGLRTLLLLLCLYLVLPSLGLLAVGFASLSLAVVLVPHHFGLDPQLVQILPYFSAGIVMQGLVSRFGLSRHLAQISLAALIGFALLGHLSAAFACFGAYLVVYAATRPWAMPPLLQQAGNLAYGIALYCWPVQQLLRQQLALRDPIVLLLLSTVITAIMAWLSFHWLEQPALRLYRPLLAFSDAITHRLLRLPRQLLLVLGLIVPWMVLIRLGPQLLRGDAVAIVLPVLALVILASASLGQAGAVATGPLAQPFRR